MLTTPNAPTADAFAVAGPRLQALCNTLRRLTTAAGGVPTPAYLVGGPVRDLLLGAPVNDLDITVVGDAIALAQRWSDAGGGRLTVHRRFGTATVVDSRGCAVDLVSARRETYPRPGALPVVRPGSIADDLARRDFTINAMAIPVADLPAVAAGRPAELVDPHNGRSDLDAGVIRILHPQSFRDDPTRILRAVRYAGRFSFRLADDTLARLQAALADDAMSTISGDRIRHEVARILDEPAPLPILSRAGDWGILAAIHPVLGASHLPDAADTGAGAGAGADDDAVRPSPLTLLAMLVWPLSPDAGAGLAARLNAPTPWRRVIGDTARLVALLPELSAPDAAPSAVCARLDGVSPYALDAARRLLPRSAPATAVIGRYCAEWQSVSPLLRGTDLLRLGVPAGPAVGEALRAIRRARLDGAAQTRQDEKRLARQWAPA